MNKNQIEKRLLDINDCAAYLGVSKYTLYRWVNMRKIPYIKCGHLLKFDPKDIENWINKNRVEEYSISASSCLI